MTSLHVVVLGIVGRLPFAGVAWQALHYLEALRRLGHDVHYVEDTGAWPFDPDRNTITADSRYTVDYLARVMGWAGFGARWCYRSPTDGAVYGRSATELQRLLERADALLNVCAGTVLREEHARVPVRLYVETDPVQPQIAITLGDRSTLAYLRSHTHHFTFGENLGTPDCDVPVGPFAWQPTRQPVVLDWWTAEPGLGDVDAKRRLFTTVASFRQTSKDIEWQGETLRWSKHEAFDRVLDLPRRSAQRFELALAAADDAAVARLTTHGWRVIDAVALTKELLPYRDYIHGASAEFTVAKPQYVRPRSGWFSDRSACYLAAGRPVVTEDTGFGRAIPTGCGLLPFRTLDDAVDAVDAIVSDYGTHARAARDIAAEYFAAERVVARLLARAGLSG